MQRAGALSLLATDIALIALLFPLFRAIYSLAWWFPVYSSINSLILSAVCLCVSQASAIASTVETRRFGMHESYDQYQLCQRPGKAEPHPTAVLADLDAVSAQRLETHAALL